MYSRSTFTSSHPGCDCSFLFPALIFADGDGILLTPLASIDHRAPLIGRHSTPDFTCRLCFFRGNFPLVATLCGKRGTEAYDAENHFPITMGDLLSPLPAEDSPSLLLVAHMRFFTLAGNAPSLSPQEEQPPHQLHGTA